MAHDENKPLVLLIDDSVDVHRLLQARLRHEHISLVVAASGSEAVQALKSFRPATILLDLDMPEMDGFELLRVIKEDVSTNNIPVIVLSGLQGSEDKVAAFDLGATDYVTKPFDMAELRARLRAALRMHQLLRLLADRADVDGLTGLGNRAHFDKRLAETISETHRYQRPLALAMLDVDHFKRINDTFGHPAGDEVLQVLAGLLLRQSRQHDVCCRYGGEEFAMIMPGTGPADAVQVAERIRRAVAELAWSRHPETSITISVGIAGSDGHCGPMTATQWIEAADRSLYAAKHAGRDRVVAANLDRLVLGRAG
ncbi:MAG TPA: diguanylate cyclase [Phycisphaerales bacterium]|nr:diguanylate cyclase [Phycisphaerales bacterium]